MSPSEMDAAFAAEMDKHWAHFSEKWIAPKGDVFRQEMRMAFVAGWASAVLRLAEIAAPSQLAFVVENLAPHAGRAISAESKAAEARWGGDKPNALYTPDPDPETLALVELLDRLAEAEDDPPADATVDEHGVVCSPIELSVDDWCVVFSWLGTHGRGPLAGRRIS